VRRGNTGDQVVDVSTANNVRKSITKLAAAVDLKILNVKNVLSAPLSNG
jgi:hypothetical protein